MTPFTRAARFQSRTFPETPLAEIVEAHFQAGHVIAGPALFLLARRISSAWEDSLVCDPWLDDPAGDTWHVWLFAGSLAALREVIPYPLEFVSFHRAARLRRHRFARLTRSLPRE